MLMINVLHTCTTCDKFTKMKNVTYHHIQFMKYPNCSTQKTQQHEINKLKLPNEHFVYVQVNCGLSLFSMFQLNWIPFCLETPIWLIHFDNIFIAVTIHFNYYWIDSRIKWCSWTTNLLSTVPNHKRHV